MSVYVFVAENGLFKIGVSGNVKARISQVQTDSPIEVACLLEIDTPDDCYWESVLHGFFEARRVKGEWFALQKADLEEIAKMCNVEYLPNDDTCLTAITLFSFESTLRFFDERNFYALGEIQLMKKAPTSIHIVNMSNNIGTSKGVIGEELWHVH